MNILKVLTPKRLIGNVGERYAAKHLKKKGYKILERNFVADSHEIDIIAKKCDTVVFVEVKTRTVGKESSKEARPACSVTAAKRRGIIKASSHYKGFFAYNSKCRFDIIEVYLDDRKKLVKTVHMESAFTKDSHNF